MPLALVDTRREYDHVASIYLPIAIGVFVLITLTVVVLVLRGRRRAPEQASKTAENNRLEGAYVIVLICVAAFLLVITLTAEHQVDTVSAHERPFVQIDVTASKWEWSFGYPGYGITHRSGVVGDAPLVVPTNVPVRFAIASQDVIHSFWIPQIDFKRDAIPGTVEHVTLDFDRLGTYSGACAEYCGVGHPDMDFTVRALSPQNFMRWARSGGRVAA